MNTFKMLPLALALTAVSTASMAMEALDDATMESMTGQAGITIEQTLDVEVGSVVYTDEAALTIGTITLDNDGSGAALTTTVDVITDSVDGDYLALGTTITNLDVGIGSIHIGDTATAGSIGSVSIANVAGSANVNVRSGGAIGTDGVSIEQELDLTIGSLTYTDTDNGAGDGSDAGSIVVSNITLEGENAGDPLSVSMSIDVNSSDQLVITQDALRGNLTLGTINIGGSSIGSVAINDINMSGTTLTVYGH